MRALEGIRAVWESTGMDYVGVEPGGVDFVEVIEAGLSIVGPCSLAVCTGGVNDGSVRRLVENPNTTDLRCYVSHELGTMNPKASKKVAAVLGPTERGLRGHVKFAVWGSKLACLTTANLNRNRRAESYTITKDSGTIAGLLAFADELDRLGSAWGREFGYYTGTYNSAFGGAGGDSSDRRSLSELVKGFR